MIANRCWNREATGLAVATVAWMGSLIGLAHGADAPNPHEVAKAVDARLQQAFEQSGVKVSPVCKDEDFLRRVSLDLTGQLPTPRQTTLFGLSPAADKREAMVDSLLTSPEFGRHWARYWRDVVLINATNQRAQLGRQSFEDWLAAEFNRGASWDEMATELLTATGDVYEEGSTGLLFAHDGDPNEVAAEASRIFLGIQIQCASCHDHPSDIWKREQFHELAAYFPRVGVRPIRDGERIVSYEVVSVNVSRPNPGDALRENADRMVRMLDRNGDQKISKTEAQNARFGGPLATAYDRILEVADADKDGMLNASELKNVPAPMMGRQANTEHYMPDLNDPASRGRLIQPKFFVDGSQPGKSLSDESRRGAIARSMTSPENPWFAKALVNRMWSELLGEGFYMPVDDIGPTREARFPEALEALAVGFTASGYDYKWLLKTITLTDAYQREIRAASGSPDELPFAAQKPTRLRADQAFNALLTVLGVAEPTPRGGGDGPGARFQALRSPRFQFQQLFGFDPSTPQDDLLGNVPQSLFLMNSTTLSGALTAQRTTRLGRILSEFPDDGDALSELYLLTLVREPSKREREIFSEYLASVGNRAEAYEDLMWSLLNSAEFLTKR